MRTITLDVSPLAITATLLTDTTHQYSASTTTGVLAWSVPDDEPEWGAWLTADAPGYEPWKSRAVLTPRLTWDKNPGGPEQLTQERLELVLLPLDIHISGTQFLDSNGQRWLWKGATDFGLYKRWLDHEDIEPIVQQRRAAGANLLRVFGMIPWKDFLLDPRQHPDFYDRLPPFAEYLAGRGMRFEFTVFAGAQDFAGFPKQQHFTRVCDVLRPHTNKFIELVNEAPKNGITPSEFKRPTGLIASAGSSLGDTVPVTFWDFFGWHGRRDWPKLPNLDDAYQVARKHNIPMIHDEPIGADEVDRPSRTTSELAMQSVASEGARLGCGATYHAQAGLRSELWGPTQERLARPFYGAIR